MRKAEAIEGIVSLTRLEGLLDRHPYDLSGGEQQRLALAKVLLLQPRLLLMDEPTKGLDAEYKQELGDILKKLKAHGITIFMISHDVEFVAEYADRVGLFFQGNVVTCKSARDFFAGNSFYTTAANRMARHYFPDAVTGKEVAACFEGKALDQFMTVSSGNSCAQSLPGEEESGQELEEYELKEDGIIIQPIHKGKIEKRTWIGLIMFLAFVPLVLFILVHKFHGKHDVVISLLILAYATIPFFMVFEGRHPQAREIMVIAVMAALGVAGRSAFFMIGSFKPIAAIVIITGVSLGGEAGFLCACLIMMISNMFFGQGPWTPWQMFSYGMIGYLAGILFQKGILKAGRWICVFTDS